MRFFDSGYKETWANSGNRKQFTAVGITVVVLLEATLTSVMISNKPTDHKFKDLGYDVKCGNCVICLQKRLPECLEANKCSSIENICQKRGWEVWTNKLPQKCENDPFFMKRVEKEVKRQYHTQTESSRRALTRSDKVHLTKAEEAFYNPNRVIFHWFPHCWNRGSEITQTNWTTLSDYERDPSTYTISPGPSGSCDKDTFIVVPETGLYNIYGKITTACEKADLKHKRVEMELSLVENAVSESTTILLKDNEESICWLKGDLLTLYQSGLFRLVKGSKLFLRYKSTNGVGLSVKDGSPFKSSFGAYRVGSAQE